MIGQVFLERQALAGVAVSLGTLLGVILLRAALAWGSEVSANAIASQVKTRLRQQVLERLLVLGPAYTGGERTGELAHTTVEGIEALDAYFSQYLPQLVLAALVPLTFLIFIFPLDLLSGAVLLITAPLIPLFMVLIGNLAQALTHRQWQTLSRMSAYFLDVLQGLATLKMLGRSRAQIQTIAQVSDHFRETTLGVLRVTFLSALALELISTLSTAVVAVEVGLRLLYGRLSFEQAFFVLLLAPEFYLPLRMLGTRFHAGMSGIAAAGRIFEVLEETDRTTAGGEHLTSDRKHSAVDSRTKTSGLDFDAVSFIYPDGRSALSKVSFEIRQGQKVALVGPSGAGKSTIAGLLLRFRENTGGQIYLDGRPLQEIPPAVWRSQVAWVSQTPYLFLDTVETNIRLARPEASFKEVVEAARLAHAHEFIQELPHGYQTLIGERGTRLSGGEAQRLALARAFLKDAPFLILDEATANLDPEHEILIGEAVDRLLVGRTALMIAHRLSTVYRCDRIIVLDQGQVVESGAHADLVERNGLYREMVRAYEESSPSPPAPLPPGEGRKDGQAGNLSYGDLPLTPAPLPPGEGRRASPTPALPRSLECARRRGRRVLASAIHRSLECARRGGGRAPTRSSKERWTRLTRSLANFRSRNAHRGGGRGRGWFGFSSPHVSSPTPSPMLHLLRLVAPFKGLVALSALLGFATTGSSIGLMATSAYIISAAALHPSIATLQTAIVGVRFFGISRGVFRYLERYVSHQVTFHVLARVRVWFYTALEPLAPARLVQQHSGDLLARIVGDIESLENFYVRVLAPPLAAILIAGGMFTFLAGYEMSLALTLLAAMLCAGLGVPLLSRFLSRVPGQELVSLRAALNTSLVDGIQGMADLLASGQEQRRLEEIISLSHRLAKAQRRMALISGLQAFLTGLLSNLGMWAVLVLTIPLVRSGQVEGAYLAVLVLAALASFEAIQPLPQAAQHLESNLESARRLLALVDATPAVHDPPDPLTLPENLPTSSLNQSFSLEIRNLSFRYPEDLTPGPSPRRRGEKEQEEGSRAPTLPYVLNDLSFNLREGQRVAIAGPSGAGKSTLVHLLLRFWEFDEGQILLGGQDLRRFNADDLREKIGVVSQNTTLFNATVRENLLIARPKATLEQIVQAAERARIHDFIESLPEGYETWIGERGLRLSGGERQRLAFARALLRDAPLLILDEATANLDPITEREVMESIYALMEGRTTLMITHRLTGLEAMDEILVLCRGRMVERGRHAELLAQGGVYHRMWELQRQRLMPSNEFLALRTGTRP